jgi:hypothetical protein
MSEIIQKLTEIPCSDSYEEQVQNYLHARPQNFKKKLLKFVTSAKKTEVK